ncbi:sterol desaturase family protein [Betaproteobacteria bacterium SCN2]|jgi:sterol desaturase/sphingolipid hydroxylase (fatty acid hydroxylase superfamily)|nr:sterol desaturase family protein [Betaproteobacteria bacterium SCN2]
MPTPIELLLDPISLAVFALYGGLMLWEALAPGRPLPKVAGWKWRGLAAFGMFFFLSSYLPLVWTEWLVQYQLVNLSPLGTWGGALIGLLVIEAGIYAWHRTMHASPMLWRTFHQMHHSSERLDSYSAFWFSPLDMVGWTVLSSLCLSLMVGITAEAATVVLLSTTFMSIFQHSNIRTPRWLGYIVQRPESHSRHHQRGVHAGNYADLPLYDMLFGTFHNPRDFVPATGFYEGASARVADMLRFRDVSSPRPQGTGDAKPAGMHA